LPNRAEVVLKRSGPNLWLIAAIACAGACQAPEQSPRRADTAKVSVANRANLVTRTTTLLPSTYPNCPVANSGEPPALSDPYQFVVGSGTLFHAGLISVEFVDGTGAATRRKIVNAIRGCVEGHEGAALYVRLAPDTIGELQFSDTDSLRNLPAIASAAPVMFSINDCMIPETPLDQCNDAALEKYLAEWRRTGSQPARP
jgi:hypothetical protein